MNAAKWFMFTFLLFALTSFMVGVADLQFLGAYADQSPAFTIFDAFGIAPATEVGTMPLPSWKDPIAAISTVWNALTWEYSVLGFSTFGRIVKWVILWPLSTGLTLAFALTLWQSIPIIGRGTS